MRRSLLTASYATPLPGINPGPPTDTTSNAGRLWFNDGPAVVKPTSSITVTQIKVISNAGYSMNILSGNRNPTTGVFTQTYRTSSTYSMTGSLQTITGLSIPMNPGDVLGLYIFNIVLQTYTQSVIGSDLYTSAGSFSSTPGAIESPNPYVAQSNAAFTIYAF